LAGQVTVTPAGGAPSVRVASAPDADGNFALEPATHHAGEAPSALFLAPFHRRTAKEGAADQSASDAGCDTAAARFGRLRRGENRDGQRCGRCQCHQGLLHGLLPLASIDSDIAVCRIKSFIFRLNDQ